MKKILGILLPLILSASLIPSAAPQGAGPQTYSVGFSTYTGNENHAAQYVSGLNENQMGEFVAFVTTVRATDTPGGYWAMPGVLWIAATLYHAPSYPVYKVYFNWYLAGTSIGSQTIQLTAADMDEWIALLEGVYTTHQSDTDWIVVGQLAAFASAYAANVPLVNP